MAEITDFIRPMFRCPIRTVKDRGTNYTNEHLTGGGLSQGVFCPTNAISASVTESGQLTYQWSDAGPVYGPNGQLEVDPDNTDCLTGAVIDNDRPVFATCKNNCPGGESAKLK